MHSLIKLSVDPSGAWSPRQAKRVLEIINPEAQRYGLIFNPVDVTSHDGPNRVILVARCDQHGFHVAKDAACDRCVGVRP